MNSPKLTDPVLVRGVLVGALGATGILTLGIVLGPASSLGWVRLYFALLAIIYFVLARGYLVAPIGVAGVGARILTWTALIHIFYALYWLIIAIPSSSIYIIHAFPSWPTVILSVALWRLAVLARKTGSAEPAPAGSPRGL